MWGKARLYLGRCGHLVKPVGAPIPFSSPRVGAGGCGNVVQRHHAIDRRHERIKRLMREVGARNPSVSGFASERAVAVLPSASIATRVCAYVGSADTILNTRLGWLSWG